MISHPLAISTRILFSLWKPNYKYLPKSAIVVSSEEFNFHKEATLLVKVLSPTVKESSNWLGGWDACSLCESGLLYVFNKDKKNIIILR